MPLPPAGVFTESFGSSGVRRPNAEVIHRSAYFPGIHRSIQDQLGEPDPKLRSICMARQRLVMT